MKPKFVSEDPRRAVANRALKEMYAWFCRSRAEQRLYDVIMTGVTKSTQNINANMCSREVLQKNNFVNHAFIIFS